MSGGSKKVTVGYRYYLGLHLGLCAGPVDAILAIKIGDRLAWSGSVTASGQILIDAPELFGGEKREGGVQGTLDVMMGESTQAANTYLAGVQSGAQPAYRGLLGLVFRQGLISANNPYIKPWAPKIRRILQGWQGGTAWYAAKASITLPSGDQAMNPAHIVYECLTNGEWGMGYGSSLIDDASFRAAADVMHAEGMGLCMQWLRQQQIEAFVQIVCDHAGMNFGQDRRTGLFVLRLLRGGHDVDALPLFDETNVISLDSYQRPAAPEQVNEITVKFDDVTTGAEGSVTVQNLANITAQGGVVTQSRSYPGLPTAELALRAALRDLRVVSSPLAKVRMTVNRAGYNLLPGDVIRLSWAKLGLSALVLRVLQVNAGTLTDGAIVVDAAEDVFELPATAYGAQQPTGWVSPNNAPAAAARRVVEEAGYYEVLRELGADATAALADDAGFVITAAGRPSGDALDYGLHTRTGSDAYAEVASGAFCPTATLAADLAPGATSATLSGIVDGDLVAAGTFAQIGAEVVRVDSIDTGTGAITLGRGVMGTVAAAHASGAVVFFRDGFSTADETERIDAEVVDAKITPATGSGELAEGSAPTNTVTLDQRAVRPYPPGRLRIAGQVYPTSLTDTAPNLTWAHRDRLQQNLQGDESGAIGPEAGTSYTVEMSNGTTNVVLASASGLAGTSYTAPTLPPGTYPLRVQVWAVRAGLQSFQRHDWTLSYTKTATSIAAGVTLTAAASFVPPQPGASVTATNTQSAQVEDLDGTPYQASIQIAGSGTDAIPVGVTFTVSVQRPMGTVLGSFSYTTTFIATYQQVLSRLEEAFDASGLPALGFYTTGLVPVGWIFALGFWGPTGVPGTFLACSTSSGSYSMAASVVDNGSAPSAGQPQISTFAFAGTPQVSDVYTITLAGVDFARTFAAVDSLASFLGALAATIDAEAGYSATVETGDTIVVTGAVGVEFTRSASATKLRAYAA